MRKKRVGEITLYTLSECKFCQAIKGALTQLRIPFKDIDVEENELAGDHIEMKLQTQSYPILFLKKPRGEYIYILSETDLEKLINIRIFNTIEEALELLLEYYYEL